MQAERCVTISHNLGTVFIPEKKITKYITSTLLLYINSASVVIRIVFVSLICKPTVDHDSYEWYGIAFYRIAFTGARSNQQYKVSQKDKKTMQ